MMAWTLTLSIVRNLLARLYSTRDEALPMVTDAGLDPVYIKWSDNAVSMWHNILTEAQNQGQIADIIATARKRYPREDILAQAERGELEPIQGPLVGADVPWKGQEDESNLEKIIGAESTLVSVSFLELGMLRARSVGRVVRSSGGMGTGFLVANNLLITNHHVLPSVDVARTSCVQFNYQKTMDGLDASFEELAFAPDEGFASSKEHDWTAVRVQGDPNKRYGALELTPASPQLKDRVNIIQHPGGAHKQLAFFHNVIAYAGPTRLQYLTDTLPGSSGSPVFDQYWKLIALHHAGGDLEEPGSKKLYYRNQGIHLNVVIEGLRAAGLLQPER